MVVLVSFICVLEFKSQRVKRFLLLGRSVRVVTVLKCTPATDGKIHARTRHTKIAVSFHSDYYSYAATWPKKKKTYMYRTELTSSMNRA